MAEARWQQLSTKLAQPWPGVQQHSGHLRDALGPHGRSRYGDAMAGLGLLQTGARNHNRRMVRTGLRALNATTRHQSGWFATAPFKVLAVSEAFVFARRHLRGYRGVHGARKQWAWWLRRQKSTYLYLHKLRERYSNKFLVDAVAILAIQKTGLRSKAYGTLLGPGRRPARARALRLLNRRIPAMASKFVLSDPSSNPIAYHALSFGLYARAVRLLGRRATARNRAVLREMAWTVSQMASPDGDVAYSGRSMEHKWTLSSAAYGLGVTAKLRGTSRKAARAYRALAERLVRRLATYPVGRRGELLTKSFRESFRHARRSLDSYARATEYTGLSLVTLNWALPHLARRRPKPEKFDVSRQSVVSQGSGRFATVRAGNLWYAVRERAGGELRSDFGVVVFKRFEAGRWKNVVPLRPKGFGSAGPLLRTKKGLAAPVGRRIRTRRDGSVEISGGFRRPKRGWSRRGVGFVVRPSPDGQCLVTSVLARANDHLTFLAFFRGTAPLTRRGSTVTGADGQRVTMNVPIRWFSSGKLRSSASDSRIRQARITVRTPVRQWVSMANC